MLRHALPIVALSLLSTPSFALPRNAPANLRSGANHHTGDDGFVDHLQREPKPGEDKLRMHEHFVAVRARLAAKHATRPELEAKRQKILAYLDRYIEQGTTPDNTHLPWSTPVFIDDKGTICAVGYLIEQSAGRPLAEKIATHHRYDFIEDIAKDMPEVRAWVEQSGFTLDELGQIQPGYPGPDVLQWRTWDLVKDTEIENGPYVNETMHGLIRNKRMQGLWTNRTAEDVVVGSGEFRNGRGTWTSTYANGMTLATGGYVANRPSGPWRFYHASGNLAAEGSFVRGQRSGAWRFYYDTKDKTPIATGKFLRSGYVTGTWKHYDATGALLASSVVATPSSWRRLPNQLFWSVGYLLDVVPGADKIQHQIHQGSIDGSQLRLDKLATADDQERVYFRYESDEVFDVDGYKLVPVDGGWRADDCKWSKARKRAARAGDLAKLHGLLFDGNDADTGEPTVATCQQGTRVSTERAARISTLVGSMKAVRAVSPKFIQQLALGDRDAQEEELSEDLMHVLAANMSLDIEWPHVDRRFIQVYETLPGYSRM
jgi:hypothetical protein